MLSLWWRFDGTVGAAGSAGFGWIDWGGRVGPAAARPVWPRTTVPAAPVRVAPVVVWLVAVAVAVAVAVVWLVAVAVEVAVAVAVAVVVGSSAGEAVMAVADRALAEAGGAVAVPDAGSTDAGPTDAGPTCRVGSPVRAHARAADASDVSDV